MNFTTGVHLDICPARELAHFEEIASLPGKSAVVGDGVGEEVVAGTATNAVIATMTCSNFIRST